MKDKDIEKNISNLHDMYMAISSKVDMINEAVQNVIRFKSDIKHSGFLTNGRLNDLEAQSNATTDISSEKIKNIYSEIDALFSSLETTDALAATTIMDVAHLKVKDHNNYTAVFETVNKRLDMLEAKDRFNIPAIVKNLTERINANGIYLDKFDDKIKSLHGRVSCNNTNFSKGFQKLSDSIDDIIADSGRHVANLEIAIDKLDTKVDLNKDQIVTLNKKYVMLESDSNNDDQALKNDINELNYRFKDLESNYVTPKSVLQSIGAIKTRLDNVDGRLKDMTSFGAIIKEASKKTTPSSKFKYDNKVVPLITSRENVCNISNDPRIKTRIQIRYFCPKCYRSVIENITVNCNLDGYYSKNCPACKKALMIRVKL